MCEGKRTPDVFEELEEIPQGVWEGRATSQQESDHVWTCEP